MEVVSYIKYLRISPKKIKKLAEAVIGLHPQEAIERLLTEGTKGAKLLAAAIKSAEANAINNFKLSGSTLAVKAIGVLKGPFLKRWQPVSRGMAHQIKKRRAHIRVVLEKAKEGEALSVKR